MGYKKLITAIGMMLLFGTGSAYANPSGTIEFPNWDSGGSSLIPRDDYAKNIESNSFIVEDMRTGKTMKILRTGGTNHMDIETVTMGDTKVMQSIWGVGEPGNWKWQTRPVVVHYKGKMYGASMSGQPHAGWENQPARVKTTNNRPGCGALGEGVDYGPGDNLDSVKGNGIDGHMDLYFVKSKGHGSGKESKSHNSALAEAKSLVANGYVSKLTSNGITTNDVENNSSDDATDTENSANSDNTVESGSSTGVSSKDGASLKNTGDNTSKITGKLETSTYKRDDYSPETTVEVKRSNPPSGSYYFSQKGVMTGPAKGSGSSTKNLKSDGKLFNKILQGKEKKLVDDFQALQESKFSSTEVEGDLAKTVNFWTYDLNKLYSNTQSTSFYISDGKTQYNIYVPRGAYIDKEGKKHSINQGIIKATIQSIGEYKKAVYEGVYGGMMITSYNLFSMYPDKQVPLVDVIDIKKGKDGIFPLKGSTVMRYSLDFFYHPQFGKIDAKDVPIDSSSWKNKRNEIKLNTESGGKLSFELDEEYKKFMLGEATERKTSVEAKGAIVEKTNGVKRYELDYTHHKVSPASMVSTLLRVITPYEFEKALNNDKYLLNSETGYKLMDGVKLLITHNKVFLDKEGVYQEAGDYGAFGIDLKGLAVYHYTLDGKIVGAVVPLWYNEAVYDPYEDKLYYTGRPIRFDNDYVNKLEFKKPNTELFSAVEKAGGNRSITIQEFAFGEKGNYLDYDSHINIGERPDKFTLQVSFLSHLDGKPNDKHSSDEANKLPTDTEGGSSSSSSSSNNGTTTKNKIGDREGNVVNVGNDAVFNGFTLVRSNVYVNDPALVSWLGTPQARALTNIEADVLKEKIMGKFELDDNVLSYEDWQSMEDIKTKLEDKKGLGNKLLKAIRVITMIFGVALNSYCILLGIAYHIDILNSFLDISLVNMMTFGRLYPIASKEELNYLDTSGGVNVKYVTFTNLSVYIFIGVLTGSIFILSTPIMELIASMYINIKRVLGGF